MNGCAKKYLYCKIIRPSRKMYELSLSNNIELEMEFIKKKKNVFK